MDQHPANNRPMVAVVMGVSGSGKTTVAILLAETLGWQFQEGDTLHPPENVAKMSAGHPLTDADRLPWLRRIAGTIDGWRARGQSGVVTCSALKRSYRDIIIGDRPEVHLVYLKGSPDLIRRRMARVTAISCQPPCWTASSRSSRNPRLTKIRLSSTSAASRRRSPAKSHAGCGSLTPEGRVATILAQGGT